ncbi:hypothetical protein SEA_CHRIS_15 [Mycobacterium phage Chris]|uniref:Uncharacterized protein n=1 Tax=Mycobacterium phage Chris TaxID=2725626 RepID=A0A6M3SXD7_9CAUD|nr:neck protein [Mycobacterium phage Chris]QJD50417.1 hypothetical protein SEA_CHRIS_15 [Mycobacterium phage Chris]
MPYRPLDMPWSEHRDIRTSPEMKAEIERIAADLRDRAARKADEQTEIDGAGDGYVMVPAHSPNRARAFVRADSGEAIAAEDDVAPLMQVSAELGPS